MVSACTPTDMNCEGLACSSGAAHVTGQCSAGQVLNDGGSCHSHHLIQMQQYTPLKQNSYSHASPEPPHRPGTVGLWKCHHLRMMRSRVMMMMIRRMMMIMMMMTQRAQITVLQHSSNSSSSSSSRGMKLRRDAAVQGCSRRGMQQWRDAAAEGCSSRGIAAGGPPHTTSLLDITDPTPPITHKRVQESVCCTATQRSRQHKSRRRALPGAGRA